MKAADLKKVQVRDNGEKLIEYRKVLIRESLAAMLDRVEQRVNAQLLIVEGYRSPERQERYFLQEFLKRCNSDQDLDEMIEHVHKFVALPSVAGHPTGGAVDLTLMIDGREVPMGCKIADFTNPELMLTYSPLVTVEEAHWRKVLHDAMLAEGFAPFYGEWWHYSYGDRERAAFYGHARTF